MRISDFSVKAGFELKDGNLIKESNGYKLMLTEFQQGYVRIMGMLVCLESSVSKEQLNEIKEKVGTKKIRFLDPKKQSILLYSLDELYGIVKEEKVNNVIEKIDLFTKVMSEMGILSQSKCIFCGLEKE